MKHVLNRSALVLAIALLSSCRSYPPRDTVSAPRTSAGKILDASGYLYDPNDTSCDGFPRLDVGTMPGTCLGLVMPRSKAMDTAANIGFVMPRTIQQIPGTNDFLIVDMGGWKQNNGRLFWMKRDGTGAYGLKLLKAQLNLPHGLQIRDGYVYLGETDRISRFKFSNGAMSPWQLVTNHLPHFKEHMHPLTQFVFDPRNGDLFINSGAPTDHCYVDGEGYKACPEVEAKGMGSIYRIPGNQLTRLPPNGIAIFEHTASGLRNSMAMVVHPSGTLIQGENSRDFPELEEPYEEINVIDLAKTGAHYGWPYCYDFHATSPEWTFPEAAGGPLRKAFTTRLDCTHRAPNEANDYQPPWVLIPPHAAPLSMDYYHSPLFSNLFGGKLLMTWHGYQPTGHRLVAYDVDERGRPRPSPAKSGTYSFDVAGTCPTQKSFTPKGGLDRSSPHTEIIGGWNQIKGVRPKGAPVSFTIASDGSIYIVEDRENRTVVRLARTTEPAKTDACGSSRGEPSDLRISMLAWRNTVASNTSLQKGYQAVETKLVNTYCASCHGGFKSDDIKQDAFSRLDFLIKNGFIEPGQPSASKIYQAISRSGEIPAMPPTGVPQFYGTEDGARILKTVSEWIQALPTDMDQRVKRIASPGDRTIRSAPKMSADACGALTSEDSIWIDPRPSAQTRSDGWVWSKAYLLPSDSRLNPAKCKYPDDGVFYFALKKE